MATAHNRVIVSGVLLQAQNGGQEIFDFGWADMSSLSPQALAQALIGIMQDAFSNPTYSCQLSAQAQLEGVRVEHIGTDGKVDGSYYQGVGGGPYTGLNTNTRCTITCLAVSLETGQVDSKGTKIRGRFYPPGDPGDVTGATFALSDMNGYLAAWKKTMDRVATAGGIVAVNSSTNVGLVAATGLSCGNSIDTQRRRKNHISTFRATSAL